MCKNLKKKIIFIINHPIDIIFSLSIINELKLFNSRFLVFGHKYFNNDIYKFIKNCDTDFILVEKPEYLTNIYLGVKKAIKFTNCIRKMTNEHSLIITFSKFELYIDLINKYFKNHISILQPSLSVEDFKKNELKVFQTYQIRRNIYEFLFKLKKTRPFKLKSTKSIVLFNKVVKNTEIFLSNKKNLSFNEITFPFRTQKKNLKTPNIILFFGSRFLEWEYFKKNNLDQLNDFLKNLKLSFENFKFIYVKHPLEKNESDLLKIDEFEIIERSINAEMIFYKMGHSIHSVYSIGSTSSKTAYEFGLKAFVIYKSFFFDKSVEKVYDRIFRGYPKCFFVIDNISKPYTNNKKIDLRNLEIHL